MIVLGNLKRPATSPINMEPAGLTWARKGSSCLRVVQSWEWEGKLILGSNGRWRGRGTIMSALAPMATPPASVAFWISIISNRFTLRIKLEAQKAAMHDDEMAKMVLITARSCPEPKASAALKLGQKHQRKSVPISEKMFE